MIKGDLNFARYTSKEAGTSKDDILFQTGKEAKLYKHYLLVESESREGMMLETKNTKEDAGAGTAWDLHS